MIPFAQLARAPNLVSLVRLPLAIAFPFVASRPKLALAVLATAGFSDVLDGWLARRAGGGTRAGAIIDPIADKAFALSVVLTLFAKRLVPAWGVPALLAREAFETPLVVYVLVRRPPADATARANVPGKVATVAQFFAVASAIAAPHALPPLLVISAVAGVGAGLSYWVRELRGPRFVGAPGSGA